MSSRTVTVKVKKPKKKRPPHPLRALFGETHLDFLQRIYDEVLNTIALNCETGFTVREYIWPWPPEGKDRDYHDSEDDSDEVAPQERGDPRTLTYHQLAKPRFGDLGSNIVSAGVPYKEIWADRDFDLNDDYSWENVVTTKQEDDNWKVTILFRGSIANGQGYMDSWVALAEVGLPILAKRVKTALVELFSGLVDDKWLIAIGSVVLSPFKYDDNTIRKDLEVTIMLSIIDESAVKPGGGEYEDMRAHFVALQ